MKQSLYYFQLTFALISLFISSKATADLERYSVLGMRLSQVLENGDVYFRSSLHAEPFHLRSGTHQIERVLNEPITSYITNYQHPFLYGNRFDERVRVSPDGNTIWISYTSAFARYGDSFKAILIDQKNGKQKFYHLSSKYLFSEPPVFSRDSKLMSYRLKKWCGDNLCEGSLVYTSVDQLFTKLDQTGSFDFLSDSKVAYIDRKSDIKSDLSKRQSGDVIKAWWGPNNSDLFYFFCTKNESSLARVTSPNCSLQKFDIESGLTTTVLDNYLATEFFPGPTDDTVFLLRPDYSSNSLFYNRIEYLNLKTGETQTIFKDDVEPNSFSTSDDGKSFSYLQEFFSPNKLTPVVYFVESKKKYIFPDSVSIANIPGSNDIYVIPSRNVSDQSSAMIRISLDEIPSLSDEKHYVHWTDLMARGQLTGKPIHSFLMPTLKPNFRKVIDITEAKIFRPKGHADIISAVLGLKNKSDLHLGGPLSAGNLVACQFKDASSGAPIKSDLSDPPLASSSFIFYPQMSLFFAGNFKIKTTLQAGSRITASCRLGDREWTTFDSTIDGDRKNKATVDL